MLKKKTGNLLLGLAFSILLIGCSGEPGPTGLTGPTGPVGPSGPGTITVYTSAVSISTSSGYIDITCPVANLSSSVSCYVQFNNDVTGQAALPITVSEADGSITSFVFYVYVGRVRFAWFNDQGKLPTDNVTSIIAVVVN